METTPQQAAEGMALVRVLAAVLDRLVCANAPLALADPGQVTKFHALKAPGIGIPQYLERIHKYASCSNECFILALIYIDRLIQRNNFLLTELNVHRVVITAILLAAKFFDDAYYNNAYYAKVGGVLVSEMNGLEVDFLFRINFSLHVTPELFQKYREELLSHSKGSEANIVQTSAIPQSIPAPPPITAPAPIPIIGNVRLEMDVDPRKPTDHTQPFVEKRHATYITPSPPPTSAQGAAVPPNSADMMHSSGVSAMGVQTGEPSFLQRANTMPPYHPPHRRCSPQPLYARTSSSEPYMMMDTVTFPIHHGTLVHHNHAKVEHGFHGHHQRHSEPAYADAANHHHHQYFMGGTAHMLTGCSGGS